MSDKKSEKKISKYLPLLPMILLGGVCGILAGKLMDKVEAVGIPSFIALVYELLFLALCCGVVVPVIHELGHLVMGLATGYEFLSFRIGSFTIVKENGRLVRRKFTIAGTGGQCLMNCKITDKPEDLPYFWYHFGGVLFNFITALICLVVCMLCSNVFVFSAFAVLGLISVGLGLINIIPTTGFGAGNDGYNIKMLHSSPDERKAMYKMLVLNAKQYQGVRLRDMPKEIITFSEQELNSTMGRSLRIVDASSELDRHNFKLAEEKFQKLVDDPELLELLKNECRCDLMFCKIVNGCQASDLDDLYTTNLQKYIDQTGKTYVMRKRLMYAYYLIIKKDVEKAKAEYDLAVQMEKTYPSRGEYISEMEIINFVKENFA